MRKMLDVRGIKFQTWLQYTLFSLFIIAFLWITQLGFLKLFYGEVGTENFTDATVEMLKIQLWITTFSILAIGVGVSIIVASLSSHGITELSKSAERLAKGDYSVSFDTKGYTEVKELANTLNYATEEIKKTENLRRELIANVSHDLRTPLTLIKGYAELIKDISGANKEKREEHLDIIIKEADRLSILVRDMLNLSQIESLKSSAEVVKVNLSLLVNKVLNSFKVLQEKEGYTFIEEVMPDLYIKGDPVRIEIVIYNLVSNAVNYTGEDKTVIVRLYQKEGWVKFEVEDSGVGLSDKAQKDIWQRYYRIKEHRRSVVGSGLGLSIVKSILDYHKSQYGVISEEGKGSTFYFSFPEYDN